MLPLSDAATPAADVAATSAVAAAGATSDDQRLLRFLDSAFLRLMLRNPSLATSNGDAGGNERWEDLSGAGLADEARQASRERETVRREFAGGARLSPAMQLQRRVFEAQQQLVEERYRWRTHLYPLNQIVGPHIDVPRTLASQPVQSPADAAAYIRRIAAVKPHLAGLVALLDSQVAAGVYLPRSVYPILLQQARGIIVGEPHGRAGVSPILEDFTRKLAALALPPPQQAALLDDARRALTRELQPGYEDLIRTLDRHAARSPVDGGVWQLPQGDEFYAFLLRQFTTTRLSAEQIHDLGLAQVERVHREMSEIMRRVGHTGDVRSFMQQLKADPQFYVSNDAAGRTRYVARAQALVDAMRARLPEVLLAAPPLRLEIRPTEAYRAAGAPSGFYEAGTPDGSRPGVVYLNLENLDSRPLYDLEALLYHEALPGHHLQISSILVDPNIPRLRKVNRWWQDSAFVEGWGLYAERLAKEMGFYQDPYSDFGRLAAELWRATRLVVDTGLHARRWTREQAIRYLDENTPSPRSSNEGAVDRYLAVPGQATAFTTGLLQILAERDRARQTLGPRFDLREFHQTVLQSGYLPLWAMTENVSRWLQQPAAATPR